MKIQSLIASAALLGVMSTSAFALTTVAPAGATTPVKFEAPAPAKVIQPILLPYRHEGSTVTLSMTIDAAGKPRNVRVMSQGDQGAYKDLLATVAQWQFTPARKNGLAVSSKIELPLQVVGS